MLTLQEDATRRTSRVVLVLVNRYARRFSNPRYLEGAGTLMKQAFMVFSVITKAKLLVPTVRDALKTSGNSDCMGTFLGM
jgi:hypothetical protein